MRTLTRDEARLIVTERETDPVKSSASGAACMTFYAKTKRNVSFVSGVDVVR